jgi:hypothetical protein
MTLYCHSQLLQRLVLQDLATSKLGQKTSLCMHSTWEVFTFQYNYFFARARNPVSVLLGEGGGRSGRERDAQIVRPTPPITLVKKVKGDSNCHVLP